MPDGPQSPLSRELVEIGPEALSAQLTDLEDRLLNAERKLKGIQEIGQILSSDKDLDRVLAEIIKRTTSLMEADRATLYLLGDEGSTMWSKSTHGGEVQTIELDIGQGIAGWVAQHGRAVNVKDAYKDKRFDPRVDRNSGYRTRSILCQPLTDSSQRILGVIQVLNKRDGYFTTADEGLLAAIASQAAVCIQNSRLYLDVVTKNIDLLDIQLKLEDRNREIELLFRIERAAATALTIDAALDRALNRTIVEYPAEAVALYLYDERRDRLYFDRAVGDAASWLDCGDVGQHTICGQVFLSGQPRTLSSADQARPGILGVTPPEGWVLTSGACLPVSGSEGMLGCLMLLNRKRDPRTFDQRDLSILAVIANRLALSIVLGKAQEEEQKAERMAAIGGMLSGVVHDLKTPLTVISGYARLMAREDDSATRAEQRLLIKRQISQIKVMTNELLAFARGESDLLLRKTWVKDFLTEVSELIGKDLLTHNVELVIEPLYRGAVKMDVGKMKRIVNNLARNAAEAMGESGGIFTIRVSQADDGAVVFEFQDDGPGIPKEMEGRLFDPFATHGKSHGTGLGLAIVKKIADEHRATLRVDSQPGKGTTFSLTLPALDDGDTEDNEA